MLDSGSLKAEVKAFWNRQSCDTQHAQADKFTRDYFEQVEQWRYRDQPFIHSFTQFTRYRGKRVLEVGFGAGTDFIQWLRAGALTSGVDLTEEALANLTHRIEVYDLPPPESIQVADAEQLPFPANVFDLGYCWGVLHHTSDPEKALAELVRVIRPGGEIKLMLYNRHSICAYKCWLKNALLKGRPWKSLRWVLANYIESAGTKGYTRAEIRRMLASQGLDDVWVETFVTSADRLTHRTRAHRVGDKLIGALLAVTGGHLGWFHCVAARKAVQ